jgi:geranylgeranyl diphosphate synthase type I
MTDDSIFGQYQEGMAPKVEQVMFHYFQELLPRGYFGQKELIQYHFSWENEAIGSIRGGKRLRPLVLLLSVSSVGGDYQKALPAAAAVEFIHNFSLIHDDIEDHDDYRHGKETVWKKYGVEKAINAGDALFSLAFLCLGQMECGYGGTNDLLRILSSTCAMLTGGQDMDLEFERGIEVSLDDYLRMIQGKTASLFEACCRMGAIIGGGDQEEQIALSNFGRLLGLAFQIRDDWLGLWGEPEKTGKKEANDLISEKKTFPILYTLQKDPYLLNSLPRETQVEKLQEMIQKITSTGAREYTILYLNRLLDEAAEELRKINIKNQATRSLESLIETIRLN